MGPQTLLIVIAAAFSGFEMHVQQIGYHFQARA